MQSGLNEPLLVFIYTFVILIVQQMINLVYHAVYKLCSFLLASVAQLSLSVDKIIKLLDQIRQVWPLIHGLVVFRVV